MLDAEGRFLRRWTVAGTFYARMLINDISTLCRVLFTTARTPTRISHTV